MKRFWVLMLALSVLFCLCGCSGSDEAAVYVQSVEYLSNAGGIAPGDRFAGVVVSENVAQVKKDEDKTVAELLVKEGDDVEAGQRIELSLSDGSLKCLVEEKRKGENK